MVQFVFLCVNYRTQLKTAFVCSLHSYPLFKQKILFTVAVVHMIDMYVYMYIYDAMLTNVITLINYMHITQNKSFQ